MHYCGYNKAEVDKGMKDAEEGVEHKPYKSQSYDWGYNLGKQFEAIFTEKSDQQNKLML